MKTIGKISIAINILLLFLFFAKRIYYAHSGPPADSQVNYFDTLNKVRQSFQEQLPIATGDIVFVGTSLTEGFPVQEMFHSLKIKNRGIAGNTSSHIMGRIGPVARGRPAKIFLEAGVNDILERVPLDTLKHHYIVVLDEIWEASPGTKIYAQSIFPLGASHKAEEKTVEAFNAWLKGFCQHVGITYVDLWSYFNCAGLLNPRYTYDDIHLNGAGYSVWKQVITPYVEETVTGK